MGNCPGGIYPVGNCPGGIYPVGNRPVGSCPDPGEETSASVSTRYNKHLVLVNSPVAISTTNNI